MKEILFLISLTAFVFCFVYFLAGKITRIKTKENKKKSFNFKNLTVKRKRILVSLFIFLLAAILVRNIIFALILCVLYLYFDWYIKDKNRCKLVDLMDKQVIEALTVIRVSLFRIQLISLKMNLKSYKTQI
jgi:hypothetical protein